MSEVEEFKKEREEKFGGQIRFMSYARYLGKSEEGQLVNVGGILFIINDIIHFEDFESQSSLLALIGQKKKYSKTEFSLELKDITIVKEIREKSADNCIHGMVREDEMMNAPRGFFALFAKSVIQLMLNGYPSVFFDLLDKEGLMTAINEYMIRPE